MYQVPFDAVGKFGSMVLNNNANWSSTYASYLESNQNSLDSLVEKMAEYQ